MSEKQSNQAKPKDEERGRRIRRLRLAFEWNQEELAGKLGCDQSTVSDIENGAGFSADLLMRMADTFKISPSMVMRGVDETSWPFAHIPIEDFLAIKPDDRPFVEGRLIEYIGQINPPKTPRGTPLNTRGRTRVTRVQKR